MIDRIEVAPGIPAAQRKASDALDPGRTAALREAAVSFEAVFLAEMFAHAGLGAARQSGGGGAGEDAFAGLLAQEWAGAVSERGGIGLADQIFRALEAREGRA